MHMCIQNVHSTLAQYTCVVGRSGRLPWLTPWPPVDLSLGWSGLAGIVSVGKSVDTGSDDRPAEPHLGTGLGQRCLPRPHTHHLTHYRLSLLHGHAPVTRRENIVETFASNLPVFSREQRRQLFCCFVILL